MKLSWVTLDRFCEERRGSDIEIRRRIEDNDRPLRSAAAGLSDDELLEKLASFGLDLGLEDLERLCAGAFSAEEVAGPLIERCGFRSDAERMRGDWIWICVACLWERRWPDKVCLELLDDKVQVGYSALEQGGRGEGACVEAWLSAWSDVLRLSDATGIRSIEAFDDRFPMTQSLYNWSQDLDDALWDAGLRDPEVLRARIAVCEEALRRFPHEDRLMTENRRRALAESCFEVGDVERAEELFGSWLAADPSWGYGWVNWATCHFSPAGTQRPRDYARAEQLLRQGYSTSGVRDRDAIAEWLKVLCEETGRRREARAFEQEAKNLRRRPGKLGDRARAVSAGESFELEDGDGDVVVLRHKTTLSFGEEGLPLDQLPDVLAAVRAAESESLPQRPKVGRNAPCPCGSGNKFKHCCGADRPGGRP